MVLDRRYRRDFVLNKAAEKYTGLLNDEAEVSQGVTHDEIADFLKQRL